MHESDSDPVEEIMVECFARPRDEWPAAFEQACAAHPHQADQIRRRLEAIQRMDPEPWTGSGEVYPERLGDFDLLERLGGGGMGVVFRARQRSLGREVALKLIRPENLFFEGSRERFRREVEAVARLQHPGIVSIHMVDEEQGVPFFAMDLLDGRTLAEVLRSVEGRAPESLSGEDLYRGLTGEAPPPAAPPLFHGSWVDACVALAEQVADALEHAHERGILHRDVKPSNIVLLADGRAILFDFGLTSSAETSERITLTGSPVGTLVYMSPEQVQARADLDARTDVYSLGVTLYELLTLQIPFRGEGLLQIQHRIVAGGVNSIRARNRSVPGDAEVVCLTAMANRRSDRYASARELARDLANVRARRPIQARPPSPLRRLLRWTQRNRAQATAAAFGLLLVTGLPTGLFIQQSLVADKLQGLLEREQGALRAESDALEEARRQEEIARQERANVLRLSAFHRLQELRDEADRLWPAVPERIDEFVAWLGSAAELMEELDFALGRREELRARALPLTPEEQEASRHEHPRYAELVAALTERDALRHAQLVRAGEAAPRTHVLDPAAVPPELTRVYQQVWYMVDPATRQFGRESEALAMARVAIERVQGEGSEEDRVNASFALAWALHVNGLDEDALAVAFPVLDQLSPSRNPDVSQRLIRLEEGILAAQDGRIDGRIAALDATIAELEAVVLERHLWTFAREEDLWWHTQLTNLIADLRSFADEELGLVRGISERYGWGVERRLAFARELEQRSIAGVEASARWSRAIASIGDPAECPRYEGLVIRPQIGLLPIGRDPRSGLWEFAHLASGSVPVRGENGDLVLGRDASLVLVLLPGGTFSMGSQSADPGAPNFDPDAREIVAPVHGVTLAPFFLSKYEMTQHQWRGLTGLNPSTYASGQLSWIYGHKSDLHPVEFVSWEDCTRVLWRTGLMLPTEAQWEYAARGGTTTIWWSGQDRESLQGVANLADASALEWGAVWRPLEEWLDDGWPVHAPIGSLAPNPFGLHEVVGNVSEWVRDSLGVYDMPVAAGDGERQVRIPTARTLRDASYADPATKARSADRQGWEAGFRGNFMGVRPGRVLELE